MGLEAIYPKPRLSISDSQHKKYPYLLKGVKIESPNHVWSTDITYIRMRHGFVYLVAILDWYSRYVLSWKVSTALDVEFCLEALEMAFEINVPKIFNSDQGSQFTSTNFTSRIEKESVLVSMDGKGRVFDNIFVERLWRSVKYEEVYIKSYETVKDCVSGLTEYFRFYNEERFHQALDYRTPQQVYHEYEKNENV